VVSWGEQKAEGKMHGKPAGRHEHAFASGAGLEGCFDLTFELHRHVITTRVTTLPSQRTTPLSRERGLPAARRVIVIAHADPDRL
jgi:hypothetical protein